ncbi:type II toxin-antitoxin system ParD family antitoxin [Niveispirillum sp. BGYR6]|uniref:type II toxin-antitoxin system ParD family antitoxin n=1 Tax=Niveispirillum sp. BGYR6 TaxID=2971249 RepID=UPI0022B9BF32|nr:type II toxin-antitoxin system ParD family antitoxin [Niveispirillum sp. BGYR6]MDG5497315.1 type II toxin-antitoxin system ParD family antitoxin [Niveispirillum sp. BGYR6]
MGRNTSFILGEHFSSFIEKQVASGRYSNASDVVRAGLRRLEEEETKLELLRAALVAGEASGTADGFDIETFIARKRAEHPPA